MVSVATVEPPPIFDSEILEGSRNSLVHPENPVMLDGILKKRFRPTFMARLMSLIAEVGHAFRAKLIGLFHRD